MGYQVNGRLPTGKTLFGKDKSVDKRLLPPAYNITVNSFIFFQTNLQQIIFFYLEKTFLRNIASELIRTHASLSISIYMKLKF